MAEDTGPLQGLSKTIPSVYYDLIARVCSGIPFLAALLWNPSALYPNISWLQFTLLVGAGYVTGLVLTPLAVPWRAFPWVVQKIRKVPLQGKGKDEVDATFAKDRDKRNDEIDAANPAAGATLAKMQAEAVLCQILFGEYVLLVVLDLLGVVPVPLLERLTFVSGALIAAMLFIAAGFRTYVYYQRQHELHTIHVARRLAKR